MAKKGERGLAGNPGLGVDKCLVCQHDDQALINMELAQHVSMSAISTAYNLSQQSLYKHREHFLASHSEQGLMVISLTEVMSIPLQMQERAQTIRALIKRCLEPLQGRKYADPWKRVPTGFLIRLMRLQQIDEQTVLKVTGVIPTGDESEGRKEILMSAQYAAIQDKIEREIAEIAQGNSIASTEARLAIAQRIEDVQYTDLGASSAASATDIEDVGDTDPLE